MDEINIRFRNVYGVGIARLQQRKGFNKKLYTLMKAAISGPIAPVLQPEPVVRVRLYEFYYINCPKMGRLMFYRVSPLDLINVMS